MVKKINHWTRNRTAVIIPTLRCNIACEHCILSCSPNLKQTVSERDLTDWVSQFIQLEFSPICLTGGEPFLYPELVNATSMLCMEHSTPLVIQTNGFWASTPDRAKRILKLIPSITQLGFSIDNAHMEFIPRETIVNGINAAYDRGIKNVSLSISYQVLDESQKIEKFFRHRFPDITIEAWPITPLGRAANNPHLSCEYDTYDLDFLPRGCEAQSCFSPIVTPLGDIHLCYHLIMLLGHRDPFYIGNLVNQRLADMLAAINDPLYRFILAYGGGSLSYLVEGFAPQLLQRKYQRVCGFCYEVFSRPELVSQLREVLSLPLLRERVEEILRTKHDSTISKSTSIDKKIICCRGKNCFKSDHYVHLRHYLLNRLVDSGKYAVATVECVDCLNSCKTGPNLMLANSREFIHNVDKDKIDNLIASL